MESPLKAAYAEDHWRALAVVPVAFEELAQWASWPWKTAVAWRLMCGKAAANAAGSCSWASSGSLSTACPSDTLRECLE
jgi:hypothetical protein